MVADRRGDLGRARGQSVCGWIELRPGHRGGGSIAIASDKDAIELAAIISEPQGPRFRLGQALVIINPNRDGLGELLAPEGLRDEAALIALGQEAAFDEDGGNLGKAEDGEAGAFHPAIELRHVAEHGVIDGGGEDEAGGIDRAAGLHVGEARLERVVLGGGSAARREGVNFEAGSLAVTIGGVEVDADEDGILGRVGDARALWQRHEIVAAAGHDHAQAFRFEHAFQASRDVDGVFLFVAVAAACAFLGAAVAGIDHDGLERLEVADEMRAKLGLDRFREIDAGEKILSVLLDHREAEPIADAIHDRLPAIEHDLELVGAVIEADGLLHRREITFETVEIRDVFDREIIPTPDFDHFPIASGLARMSGAEERETEENEAETGGHGRLLCNNRAVMTITRSPGGFSAETEGPMVGQGARSGVCSSMLKTLSLIVASAFAALTLQAQTAPKESKPIGDGTPPPNVQKPSKPPTGDKIPPPATVSESKGGAAKVAPLEKKVPAFDIKNMDTSVKPQDDFYTYANGGWLKKNPIPAEESRWGSFSILLEKNQLALKEAAEKAAANKSDAAAGAPEVQKVGDYYASGMDEKSINAAKAKPLEQEFKMIEAIDQPEAFVKEIAHLHKLGVGALFGFTSGQDDKQSSMVIAQAYQGGLGMPDRDYYTKDDEASKKLRDGYVAHVTKMLTLMGEPAKKAAEDAKKILAIETELAKVARTRVELRNPEKNYNKMTLADLQPLMPNWNWAVYFREIGLPEPGPINVGQPDFFIGMNALLKSTPMEDWKTYLRWHLVHATASELSDDFVNEDFKFFGTTLTGAKVLKPRWKRVIASTDQALGEALGKIYVAENFPPESKARMIELVKNVQEAMADSIKSRDWMDDATKEAALKKLAAFSVKIGYPDKWRDYSDLKIERGPYVLNAMRAAEFETTRELQKIGKPVDRNEWGMTPPTVNAYFSPNMNEIVFPAGHPPTAVL